MNGTSTFADRLWWARHKKGLGATKLARAVGCAQSLISSLERNNAESSKLNNKFAKVLEVDSHWLALGSGLPPEGFDPEEARRGREGMSTGGGVSVIPLPSRRRIMAGIEAPIAGDADMLMKSLIDQFQDFAKLAGPERTKALLGLLSHLSALVWTPNGPESRPSA